MSREQTEMLDPSTPIPSPRDGSPVVCVAVDGVPLTWIGEIPGVPGDGEIAGDGTRVSRLLIAAAKRLWEDPIEVDHPSFAQPVWTVPGDPRGVLATLLHLGHGRAVIVQAPEAVLADVFGDEAERTVETEQSEQREEGEG